MAVENRAMQVISRHMETLKDHTDGGELYALVARALRRYGAHGELDTAALTDLHDQLEIYARDPIALPGMRVRARLLQQHIAGFLPEPQDLIADEPPHAVPPPAGTGATTEKYKTLLRSEKDAWQAIYGTVKDYYKLKQAWMHSLDELARQRDTLEHKLVQATTQLTTAEVERDELRHEVEKLHRVISDRPRATIVRLAVRPSQKAGVLARRDTLERQLGAEINRLKRSSRPLALGLLALDGMQELAATEGKRAVEAALQCYVQEILSSFRAYDLVAFYQNSVFAILFPDTSHDGAQRALEKAHKRAAETHIYCGDRVVPLPRFVSTLVLYQTGEDTAALLRRAETQLAAARADGTLSGVA